MGRKKYDDEETLAICPVPYPDDKWAFPDLERPEPDLLQQGHLFQRLRRHAGRPGICQQPQLLEEEGEMDEGISYHYKKARIDVYPGWDNKWYYTIVYSKDCALTGGPFDWEHEACNAAEHFVEVAN